VKETRMKNDELTPEEKREFDNLPRQAVPSAFLWERIVRSLREDGTLRNPAGVGVRHRPAELGGRWLRPWVVAAASIAASLLLFGSGVLLGHWMGTRSTERAFLAVREQDAAHLAQRVQETGSAYVSALAALGDLWPAAGQRPGGGTDVTPARAVSEIRRGREAAFAALYGATVELVRIAPGDPDVTLVLRVLEERRFGADRAATGRRTVWY
jgi:hypothetical protein